MALSHVVDSDVLMNEVGLAAEKMLRLSMSAIRRTRVLLLSSLSDRLETYLEREAESIAQSAREPDGREGIASFVAKRRPLLGRQA